MKSFNEYIFEKLTKEQQDNLLSFVDDTNYNDIMSLIKNHLNKDKYSTDKHIDFYTRHGLSAIEWRGNGTAQKYFSELFSKSEKLDVLNAIIENDGVVSMFDKKGFSKLPLNGNIYDFCKVKVGNDIISFKDEAMDLITWTSKRGTTIGAGEILLKFLLKEGGIGKDRNILIRHNEQDYLVGDKMKVSIHTVSDKNSSGYNIINSTKLRRTWAIYWYLEKKLFKNEDIKRSDVLDLNYFQNEEKCNTFIDKVKENEIDNETLVENIIEAVAYQYRLISETGESINDGIFNKETLIKRGCDVISHRVTFETLKDLLGCIQLFFYTKIEDIKYLMCLLFGSNSSQHVSSEGKYVLFRCSDDTSNELLNFKNVLEYLYFGEVGSSQDKHGCTGKIYFKI